MGELELYWNMSVVIFGHTDQFHFIDTVVNACPSKLISTYASFYVYWSNPLIILWSFELIILKISSGEMLVDPWRDSIKNIKFVKLWRRNRFTAYTLQWRRRRRGRRRSRRSYVKWPLKLPDLNENWKRSTVVRISLQYPFCTWFVCMWMVTLIVT
jgi:hypothetical protein